MPATPSSAPRELARVGILQQFDQAIRQYFEAHHHWPIVSEVASLLGTDCRGLRRWLTNAGYGPSRQLLSHIRVRYAAAIIASGVKIEAARSLAGYAVSNKTAFNTQFRKCMGCTPQEFKARCSTDPSSMDPASWGAPLVARSSADNTGPALPLTADLCAHVWYRLEWHPRRRPTMTDLVADLDFDAITLETLWHRARRASLHDVITYGCLSFAWLLIGRAHMRAYEAALVAGLRSYKNLNRLSKKYANFTATRCGEGFPFLLDRADALRTIHVLHAKRHPPSCFFDWPPS